MKQFQIGDRVRTTRSMDHEYFYGSRDEVRAKNVIIANDALGVVVDTHEIQGAFYPYVCVNFALAGTVGSWYVDVNDLVLEGE